jgi:putrescine transport system permease protein
VPFFFTLKISFADSVIRIPPFTDILTRTPGHHLRLTLSLASFRYLFTDELYGLAYLFSLRTALVSTLVCLLIGYPMAYAIARAPRSTQNILLLVVIQPFWTSFLLRVYALEAIIDNDGLLNSLLLRLGLISHPLIIMRTNLAIYIGIVYSYLPFMVLPLFATLE